MNKVTKTDYIQVSPPASYKQRQFEQLKKKMLKKLQ